MTVIIYIQYSVYEEHSVFEPNIFVMFNKLSNYLKKNIFKKIIFRAIKK
jgi:predicted HTH transcriptional regulator